MVSNDQVVIDLSSYKDKVGARVPEGRYRVFVTDCETDKSAAGNQMINLYLEIVGGEYAGAALVDRLVLTEKSLFRVVGFMQALGLPTPKKRLSVNIAAWKGKHVMADVSDGEPYNGRVKSEVKGYEKVRQAPAATESADNAALEELAGATAQEPLAGLGEFAAESRVPEIGVRREAAAAASDLPPAREELDEALDEVDLDSLNL